MSASPEWWTQLRHQIESYRAAVPAMLPGAVCAVETLREGPLVAAFGDGWNRTTICCIGSMSKPFIATALLLALEDDGRLDVETPVYRLPGMDAYAEHPQKRRIRVRDLLQHTSGMPVFLREEEFADNPCRGADDIRSMGRPPLDVGPTVPWIGAPGYTNERVRVNGQCVPARLASLADVSRHVMQTYPLVTEPGTKYGYSSANYIVAARLVETLTGRSPNRYLKERLFSVLGMRDSFFVAAPTGDAQVDAAIDDGVTDEQRARIAEISLITRDGLMPPEVAPGGDGRWDRVRRGWRFVYPDGGMYSTVDDLLAYLRLLRDRGMVWGRRVLSDDIMRLLVDYQQVGQTMAFHYRTQVSQYGQRPGTIEHFGNLMTYFWCDPTADDPLIALFLSQRLPNGFVNNNAAEGMRAIFRVFVPSVMASRQATAPPVAAIEEKTRG